MGLVVASGFNFSSHRSWTRDESFSVLDRQFFVDMGRYLVTPMPPAVLNFHELSIDFRGQHHLDN